MECGDSVLAPGDCSGICGDFAEVASLADAGGAPVYTVPPAVLDGIAIAGMSHAEQ